MTRPASSGPLSLLLGCLLAVLNTTAPAVDQTVNFTDGSSSSTNYTILNAADTLTLNIGSGMATYAGKIEGGVSVIKTGGGTLALTAANSYSGTTFIQGGTLELAFGTVGSFILAGSAAMTADNASLKISNSGAGDSFQALNTITVRPYSAATLVMGAHNVLALNSVTLGSQSAVSIDASAGGVIGPVSGTSHVLFLAAPDGPLLPTVTFKDAAGFGLAEVFAGQIIRATDTALLPSSGADASTDYLIDNNAGGASAAGSSSLQIMATESARSITVDTTATVGSLEIRAGLTLFTDIWNFGGVGSNAYSIIGGAGSALSPTLDGSLQINNFNTAPVTISAPIAANGTNELLIEGTGKLILTSTSTLAATNIIGGTVVLDAGGSFDNSTGTLAVGFTAGDDTTLNVLNGSVQVHDVSVGVEAGSHGILLVQRGQDFRDLELGGTLTVGVAGSGVMDLNGGHVLSYDGQIANQAGSSGTVTVENGGEWLMSRDLAVGTAGSGTLNLISGRVDLNEGGGQVTLGSSSTINFGLGGSTATLGAGSIAGTDLTSVVNFNFSADSDGLFSIPDLEGTLSVVKSGSSVLMIQREQTYAGTTTVNGGVLNVVFNEGGLNMLNPGSSLVLGGGSVNFILAGTQTLNGLTTTAGTGSALRVGASETLNLGALTVGANSALNFITAQGGNDGATVGTSIITLTGQTPGEAISSGFTVQDSTGFGLATVNGFGQVIRMTVGNNLLPNMGAVVGMDYLIDNHIGSATDAGSNSLEILSSESAKSITVDSTVNAGQLSITASTTLQTDVWNFGGDHTYEIASAGADSFSGISTTTSGGVMQMNNYNSAGVNITGSILDNGGSGLQVSGTGLTNLNGTDTYTGATTVAGGTLSINGDHTLATGTTTVMSGAYLGGTGTLGGDLQIQQGGTLLPGSYLSTGVSSGTLSGISATFQPGSVFNVTGVNGGGVGTLQLSGAVHLLAGSYLSIYFDSAPTASSFTLMTAASGLDGTTKFTLMSESTLPAGYALLYTGNTLQLFQTAPATAFWTGAAGSARWSEMNNGTTNWATTVDGTTDTNSVPGTITDVTFSASTATNSDTILDTNYTINSLTVNTDTSITDATGTPDAFATLTVNTVTSINALLAVNAGATLRGDGALTVSSTGTLAGDGTVQMAQDQNMYISGAISVGNPATEAALTGQQLSLTTSGTGAIVMGAGSVILVDLFSGAGAGDNTAQAAAADQLNLNGTLDATAGGTLVLRSPNGLTGFSAADKWQVINLNGGAGTITGTLAVDASALSLAAAGFSGTFDSTTGVFSLIDHRPELSMMSGLSMANAEMLGIIAAAQTATTDVNGHLFALRNGDGEDEESDGSIGAALDFGVVTGEGDGPESPMAQRIPRSHQWQVFATVNYGNVRLNPINAQAGLQADTWASSVGIDRRIARGLTLGFAATFLQSTQNYTSGLGSMHLEGPTLSTYLAYARKGVWASLMYSFGDYDLGTFRNPGFGLPVANGGTTAYVNSVQFNTGYNFYSQDRTFITGPFIGIDYLHGSVDAYAETGGGVGALAYGRQSFDSLVTRVGWSAAKRIHTNWAEITPQFRLSYERQNIHNNGTSVQSIIVPISAAGGNQMPGRDYMVIGGGINFQITPSFSILLNYQTQVFRDSMTSHFGSIRLGYKF